MIRAGTALAVIAIHVTAGYMDLALGYGWNHLVRFAVPLFLVLSGLSLHWNDLNSRSLPVLSFYRKRLQKILLPYFIWTLVYSGVNAYLLHLHGVQLWARSLAVNLLWGSAYYHLYFITIIFQMYLLYPLLRWWMKKSPVSLGTIALVLSGTCQILHYLNLLSLIYLPPQFAPLYLRGFPIWLFYFVFGMFAAQYWQNILAVTSRLWLLVGAAWLASLGWVILDSRITGIYVSIVRPSIMLYAVCSYFFFLYLARRCSQGSRPWPAWLALQSYLIYLMHPLVLTALEILARKTGHPALWKGPAGLLGFYATVTAFTIAGTYCISRTPWAAWLGGVSRPRPDHSPDNT